MAQEYTAGQRLIFKKLSNYILSNIERKLQRPRLRSKPLFLMLDPSTLCNLRCPECPIVFDRGHVTPGLLSFETFQKVLDSYGPYALMLFLYDKGEPFLNKHIYDMIAYARRYHLKTTISSNMHFVDPERVVASGLDTLIMSIDGASQAIYSSYRGGGQLDKVLSNVKAIVREKRERNTRTPRLVWQYLLFEHNHHELERAKQMAAELGVDTFMVGKGDVFTTTSGINPYDSLSPLSLEKSGGGHQIPTNQQAKPGDICKWLWSWLVVNPQGLVFPCCILWNDADNFGDSDSLPTEKLYNTEAMLQARKHFVQPTVDNMSPCASCTIFEYYYLVNAPDVFQYLQTYLNLPTAISKKLSDMYR